MADWIDPDVEMQVLEEASAARTTVANLRATPQDAERARQILRDNPNLSLGLLNGLVAAQADDDTAAELASQDDGGVLGGLFDVAGDVIGAVADGAQFALDKANEYFVKPTIRGVISVADAASQELVQRPLTAGIAAVRGDAPSFGAAYDAYGDSALVNVAQGQGTLGTGFLPGDTAYEQSNTERTLKINGRRADVGQAIAASTVGNFVDPGSAAYDLVAGVSGFAVEVFGDPLALATGGASKLATAARTLDKAGAIKLAAEAGAITGSRRNTVLIEKASDFFRNEKLLTRLAEADAYEIMQKWTGSAANRIDHKTINALGKATDEGEVAQILLEAVKRGDVTERGFYSGVGHKIKSSLVDSTGRTVAPLRYLTAEGKLSGLAPTGSIDAKDLGTASQKLDSMMRQANVGRAERAEIFNRMVDLEDGDFGGLFDVATDAMNKVAGNLADGTKATLNDVVHQYRQELDSIRQYGIDSWGDAVDVPYAKRKIVQNFDGTTQEVIVPTPQILAELNSLAMHLPEVTDIRRAATQNRVLRSVYTNKGWEVTADSTRWVTSKLFKPLAILRPAYIVRIGAEEQARLTAAGFDSIFSHPARFINANIRNRKSIKTLVGEDGLDVARANGVITRDAQGIMFDKAQSQGRVFTVVKRAEGETLSAKFTSGWRSELGQISSDDGARQMTALRGNRTEFKAWAQTDEGMAYMREFATAERKSLLEFGEEFDQWADGVARRVEAKTAGFNEDLVDRIVNRDIPLNKIDKRAARKAKTELDGDFNAMLRRLADEGKAPAAVKAELVTDATIKHRDMFVNNLFDWIAGKPTSALARYPAFRQSMVRRTGDLMDSLASNELREEAFNAAVKNLGMTKKEIAALRAVKDSKKGLAGPIDNIADLDSIVVSKSSQDVKDLLFDVTQRGAGQQAMEAVVPFLDAWKEVTQTWAHLVKENPAYFVRAQAGFRELQDQGHFYTNDYGDEVFRYPGGGVLSSFVRRMNEAGGDVLTDTLPALGGAVVDSLTGNTPEYGATLEGRVEGLNLVAQGVGPGFGPVIQWAAGVFDSPDLDTLRGMIAPFGTGGIEEGDDLLDLSPQSLAPAWMKKMMNAVSNGDIDERQWNSTVGDAMKALATAEEEKYATNPKLLQEDATRFAHWLLIARSFTQFAGPTGAGGGTEVALSDTKPTLPDWNPEFDPDGRVFSVGALSEDYYRLLTTYGPEMADQKFYDLYGAEPFFLKQAKSRSLKNTPVTAEGDRWMRNNQDLLADFPEVVGYFAPVTEDMELDFGVYSNQFLREERQSLTGEQQVQEATKSRARAMYQAVKDRVEGAPTEQKDAILNAVQGRLESLYPGWQSPTIGLGDRASTKDKIAALQRAVADPRLAESEAAKPLRTYFAMRAAVLEVAKSRGLKTLSSDKLADVKAALNEAGRMMSLRYPAFKGMWNEVLAREIE